MIDTLTLSTTIHHATDSVNYFLQSDQDIITGTFTFMQYKGIPVYIDYEQDIACRYYPDSHIMHIQCNPSRLIGRTYHQHHQQELIKEIATRLFYFKFIDWDNLKLNRVDYKMDCKPDPALFDKYFKLYAKADSFIYKNNKKITAITNYGKSKDTIIYDKSACDIAKNKYHPEHDGIIRFETHVKNSKLNYHHTAKNWGCTKELLNYDSFWDAQNHLDASIARLIGTGDYYPAIISKRRLKEHFRASTVGKLIDFQTVISRHGMRAAKTDKHFNLHMSRLKQANINPVPIPKHWGIEYLPQLYFYG